MAPALRTARPASRLLDGACGYRGARARCGAQADRRPFGSPTVPSSRARPAGPSDWCHPQAPTAIRGFWCPAAGGSAGCWV